MEDATGNTTCGQQLSTVGLDRRVAAHLHSGCGCNALRGCCHSPVHGSIPQRPTLSRLSSLRAAPRLCRRSLEAPADPAALQLAPALPEPAAMRQASPSPPLSPACHRQNPHSDCLMYPAVAGPKTESPESRSCHISQCSLCCTASPHGHISTPTAIGVPLSFLWVPSGITPSSSSVPQTKLTWRPTLCESSQTHTPRAHAHM